MTGKGEGKGVTATPQYRTHHAVAARDQDEALKVKVGSGARHPCLLNASCTRRAKQQSSPKLAQVVHASHHKAEDTRAHTRACKANLGNDAIPRPVIHVPHEAADAASKQRDGYRQQASAHAPWQVTGGGVTRRKTWSINNDNDTCNSMHVHTGHSKVQFTCAVASPT